VLNIGLSFAEGSKSLSNLICNHLNILYSLDFMVQLVNLFAYYHIHDISSISNRYQECMVSFVITFLLLIFIMNEERYAPAEPIVADTVSNILTLI
jgi:hypothetical protein